VSRLGQVAVIDPGTRVPEIDCFNRMSLASPLPLTYHLVAQYGTESLARGGDDIVGIVVLGSGASVNDDAPWLEALSAWLEPRVAAGVPALGLCFGHQLLARLLGGRVGFLFDDRRKLRGMRRVSLAANRLWGEAAEGPLLVTHAEVVAELPPECDGVGRSDEVAVEAFAHRTLPVWGFQAHPEATPAFARNNAVPFDADPAVLAFGHGLVDAFLQRVGRPYAGR
jgi:GMP synthase-like glutamine amidotransferase